MSVKLIYLCWPASGALDRAATRARLVDDCGAKLLALGPARLVVYSLDPESTVKLPSPFVPKDPPPVCGLVDLWLESADQRGPFEDVLRTAGFKVAGYEVEESVYREYGGNPHAGPRTWADGQRSPGIAMITLLERPPSLPYDEWLRRWHGRMSPVSEAIQPRTRYVRNRILGAVTPGAPNFAGVVAECWPSARHMTNPFLFYGATNPVRLAINLAKILAAVTSFLSLRRIWTTATGEYFLKTDFKA